MSERERVEDVRERVTLALVNLSRLFTPEMRLTFIARHPDFPEREMIITEDDLDGLAGLVERSRQREDHGTGQVPREEET